MSYSKQLTNSEKRKEARRLILELLSDGQRHHITQLHQIPLPYEQIDIALEELMLEEDVYIDGAFLTKA